MVLSPSAPDRRPIDLRMVEMKSSANPPRVSATRHRAAVGGQLALDALGPCGLEGVERPDGRWSNWVEGRQPGEKRSLESALEFL